MIFVAPGVTKGGGVCERPVDFLGVYPTLADLCGLPVPEHVQSVSLRPLLADPKAPWQHLALTTHGRGEHAVRSQQWRYIRYHDGTCRDTASGHGHNRADDDRGCGFRTGAPHTASNRAGRC